jgi:hypothetical protein
MYRSPGLPPSSITPSARATKPRTECAFANLFPPGPVALDSQCVLDDHFFCIEHVPPDGALLILQPRKLSASEEGCQKNA